MNENPNQKQTDVQVLPPRDGGSLATNQTPAGAQEMSLQALEKMAQAVDYRVQLLDRMKVIIDARVGMNCFDRFEAKKKDADGREVTVVVARRNKNYADTMAAALGISFEYMKMPDGKPIFIRTNYQDDAGPYYVYECFGRAFIPGVWGGSDCSAACSSRDPFLSRGGNLDVSDVNETFVRQKCLTECRKKGILAVLGLDADATAADLERVGKDAKKLDGHTFASGSKGGNTATGALADKKSDIERMARELLSAGWMKKGEPVPTTADQVVFLITKNGNFAGWKSIKGISEKGLEFTHKDVKRIWEDTIGAQGQQGGGEGEMSDDEKAAAIEKEARGQG